MRRTSAKMRLHEKLRRLASGEVRRQILKMLKVDQEEQRVRAMVQEAMRDLMLNGTPDQQVADAAAATVHPSEYTLATYPRAGSPDRRKRSSSVTSRSVRTARGLVLARGGVVRTDAAPSRMWKIAASVALVSAGLLSALLGGRALGDRLGRPRSRACSRPSATVRRSRTFRSACVAACGRPSGLTVKDPDGGEPMLTASNASFSVDGGPRTAS